MGTAFPTALDVLTNPISTDNLGSTTVPHSDQHANANDAIEALEAKVGVDGSTVVTTLDHRIVHLEQGLQDTGWKDLISNVSAAPGGVSAPALVNFGPAVTPRNQQYAFAINDYVYLAPFHVDHDIIETGSLAYIHVHWSTDGTNVQPVKWEMTIHRAIRATGDFNNTTVKTVTQAASGTAWKHMVTEVGDVDALTLTIPDELIIVTLRRVTNGGTDNTDNVFGLMVDFHYQTNRSNTPNKAAPFY